jgi:methionyl-tRNA formyltransferase
MRIVFVGTVALSRAWLEETIAVGGDVAAVLTLAPERASAHSDYEDLAQVAARFGIPVHRVAHANDEATLALVRSLEPDVLFVLGWSQLLGRELLRIAPAIGSHPALLPRDRGRHPITWSLVDGLEESGLTFLWLDEGADTGDILWQRSFPIGPDDDAADVYAKLEALGREAIREFLPQLEAGSAPRVPQDEPAATYRRKRTDEDRVIDWDAPSLAIHNLVRGLARPYVGALTRRGGQDVLVWRTRLPSGPLSADARSALPGTVVADRPELAVRTGDGHVILVEVEAATELHAGDVLGGAP